MLDASPWSLPSCSNAAKDRRNPTEAVFLSPDADADGDNDPDYNQLLPGTWTIDITAAVGGTDPAQRFALVIGGGVTVRSTIRWAPGPFACNEPAVLKLLEVDEPNDPGAALTPAEIASRVTIRVLDPDTRTVLDEETGVTSWSQPIPGIAGFESDPLLLSPDSTPTIGNGLVEVDDARIVEAIYADEIDDAAEASRESRTSNPTTCGLSAPGEAEDLLVTDIDPATGEISISYTAACSAVDHTLVLGPLGQVSTYGYSDQVCDLGTAGTASFASDPGSLFYLVVANDGTTEGPYGQDSEGVERPGQNPQPSCSFEHLPGLACE